MAHVGLNQRKQAFAWLEKACEIHDPWLFVLLSLPIAARLKADPRYHELLHRFTG
jgi:hypothetical protein